MASRIGTESEANCPLIIDWSLPKFLKLPLPFKVVEKQFLALSNPFWAVFGGGVIFFFRGSIPSEMKFS